MKVCAMNCGQATGDKRSRAEIMRECDDCVEYPANAKGQVMHNNTHFNGLTPAQAERLAILAEECGEVIQAIGKILRHGFDSSHPDEPRDRTNRRDLEKECGDVRYAIFALCDVGDLNETRVRRHAFDKATNIKPYLHHQDDHDHRFPG